MANCKKNARQRIRPYKSWKKCITNGLLQGIHKLPSDIRSFFMYSSQLYTIDEVVMLGQRIVVPTGLREQILQTLHAAHQGVDAMSQRASCSVYWPGTTCDITRFRKDCMHCDRIENAPTSAIPIQRASLGRTSQGTSRDVYRWHYSGQCWHSGSTSKGEVHLLTLEALWIRELKPFLNTQDTMRSRYLKLTIKFWMNC